ncbi:MAG: homogentisate 1,2-dioxygenase [Pseudomonadota bacterium]|uniref:homogentisate 1,2-dioxygenase n=1 Tax=Marisediminitalea sp. TaxID=2662268 RepID=UPI000C612AAF|nr:homogentisate 1,2-dioxygenase [Alteromonadaceae bacterium]MEC8227181.1 homogentisate 1,2-dioxygenase [Pseudomonadota bacterium]|tara:strand:+ start:1498 stop:2628 length:1131 start_codon:yes stop_codon:yes gene_type:complete
MRNPARFPIKQGLHSRQAHADLPEQALYEREVGRDGFFGPASHIHHKHAPTGWTEWEGELRPRAFDLMQLNQLAEGNSPFSAPVILHNAHCQYRFWHCDEPMQKLARNADGDDLLFVHKGEGDFYCDYGHFVVTEGDYVVIPRSTMWRLAPRVPMQLLMIEATDDSYQLPEKGLVGNHAIFDPAMLRYPEINDQFLAQQDENTWQVEVKRHQRLSRITYPFNPLDAQGWHGDLTVMKINWRDIRPLMSHRYHLPPSAHTTFVAKRFVVCTFVPRPIESDPGALKVPFYHSNDDFDEVLFYHAGDFFSRDNIEAGMVTFHPAGFTHGPHPKAFAAGQAHKKTFTDEVAVMLDTRDALEITAASQAVENAEYVYSWKG